MDFFTSDQHLGHANLVKQGKRPFRSVDEMDEALIRNWNAKVGMEDRVFIMGDLFMGGTPGKTESTLARLNGRKVLIIGNHDSTWTEGVRLDLYFEQVSQMLTVESEGRRLTLCHYPLLTWGADKNLQAFMIHGHIHDDRKADFWPLLQARERVLNAGVDINGYEPVSFPELYANNRIWKEKR